MEMLKDFLRSKPLYYKEIDHKRVHIAYGVLKPHIKQPKTIHIVGTNGKGSTGRMVAHLSSKSGLSVGHYSSPHILKYNERFWIDGVDISDQKLDKAHQKLFTILKKEISSELSYFEYSTLLALVLFEECDLLVLEAGLGGEFDATNVCSKELSIVTPIGIDHQSFLGDTIKEIATTKINSIEKKMLLAPQIYDEVLVVAKEITTKKNSKLFLSNYDKKKRDRVTQIAKEKGWAEYLVQNAIVALQSLDILGISYSSEHLKTLELFGRFYLLKENIRIDVGHNPLAAKAIVEALSKDVVLIYNSLDDKDYKQVLNILKPKIKRVEIIAIDTQRATTQSKIKEALDSVEISYRYFKGNINKSEEYLVFGSFYVVEKFLKMMKDR